MADKTFYRVLSTLDRAPLRDYLLHGYEERLDFYRAVKRLVDRWHNRIGERIAERHGHYLLRFYDTPGCVPDEAWIPTYLVEPSDLPEYMNDTDSSDGAEEELDKVFGFD